MNYITMCNTPNQCGGGTAYCCEMDCSSFGGNRPCPSEGTCAGTMDIASDNAYAIYINGKLMAESKTGVAVRQGGQPRGAHIYSDLIDEFKGGQVTLAVTSFLRYNHPRRGLQPPRGHISLQIDEQKLPPLE